MTTTYLPNKYLEYPAYSDSNWSTPIIATTINTDSAFGGVQAFNLAAASGTVSVTGNTYAGAYPANTPSYVPFSWSLSGTLTANVNLQLPSGVGGHWAVYNTCTMGSYTITISSAGGGNSIQLYPGDSVAFFSDGTNVTVSPNNVYGSSTLETSITLSGSNVTLTAAQASARLLNLTGTLTANVTLTFPAAPINETWINNACTMGSYTINVVSVGAGTSALFSTTGIVPIFHDATNITQLISSSGGSSYAPLASPAFTGTPTAPTASTSTNNTQLATTAYVQANLANYASSSYVNSQISASLSGYATTSYVSSALSGYVTTSSLATYAPLASPTFTGTPAAPTASTSTSTTQIATTAYVQNNLASYATTASLSSYATTSYVSGNYATISYVSGNYATVSSLASASVNYANSAGSVSSFVPSTYNAVGSVALYYSTGSGIAANTTNSFGFTGTWRSTQASASIGGSVYLACIVRIS